jgi:hypothetical protein
MTIIFHKVEKIRIINRCRKFKFYGKLILFCLVIIVYLVKRLSLWDEMKFKTHVVRNVPLLTAGILIEPNWTC